MESSVKFARELAKGRIAETIFEFMFRDTNKFTVLRFGYEYTQPILAQYRNGLKSTGLKVLHDLENAPDFALLTENKQQLYLIEVKYRHVLDNEKILKIAKETVARWGHAYLFIASPDEFFFDPCNNIINEAGHISILDERWVSMELKNKYLSLLKEFELEKIH